MRRRQFVFLQGPPGAFFWRLRTALVAARHDVWRINLNGGDRASWPGKASDYRGSEEEWPLYFDSFVRNHGITDVVLFGDCRPLHSAARGLARRRGLRVYVFEEGYIRPDWVTLELGGVNGNSTLPREPHAYLDEAAGLPPVPRHVPIASSFRRRAGEALNYYSNTVVQAWRFPCYRSHRHPPALVELFGWVRRLATKRGAQARARRVIATLPSTPYFVFPLQLDSDAQVRVHSPFTNVRAAVDYIIDSFARTAPADVSLVVKLHPLDNGLTNWRRVTAAAAKRFGVGDRVLMLEDGDIAKLVAGARGVVTINSTTGTLALSAGVPTVVLGDAVYDIAGITHQGALDGFWTTPVGPDDAIWDAFCRVLLDRCLVRGGFLSDEGLDLLVAGSVARLTAPQRTYDHV